MGEVGYKTLAIDIETFSDVDLIKCGVYAYADSPAFEILLFAYSFDDEETKIIDLAQGEQLTEEIKNALSDVGIIKTAFNANFERTCLSKYMGVRLSPESWVCTAVQSAMLALPLSLEGVGAVLGLSEQKLKEGKDLIRYFCVPCKPTKTNGGRSRNLPFHAPEKWKQFKTYCIRDVDVEKGIRQKLHKFPIPESEMAFYRLDQEINDRGVLVDRELVEQSITCDLLHKDIVTNRAYEVTGLENPNSVSQLKGWLSERGVEIDSLSKGAVAELIEDADGEVLEALKLRLLMAKTSVKKYEAIERSVCSDGRVHGLLQFYGANRTGRWAGRLVQVQNLPQNHISDLELARSLVRRGQFEELELFYESKPNVLSELIRTAFIPKEGCRFSVADFSAIEARVIAWLAGETWRQKVFADGKDIYCASASQMFGVPVEKHGINGHLRQKGKIAELALCYGGSVGALKAMGALDMGLSEEELPPLVDVWRQANPNITKLWWDVDRAAMEAVRYKHTNETHGIEFSCKSGMLFIILPSGRQLSYVKPKVGTNKFGGDCITYEGVGGTKKWERLDSYGPKFVENIVQATSRDILCYAMKTLRCCSIVMHIHDEVVIEADRRMSLQAVCDQMGRTPPWANGLQLRADGYETDFYKKD